MVSWVGLDIKATPDMYQNITTVGISSVRAFESLQLVLESGVPVQIRTTVDENILSADDVARLEDLLLNIGAPATVIQKARYL